MRHRLFVLVAIVLALAGCASTPSKGASAPTTSQPVTTSLPATTVVPAAAGSTGSGQAPAAAITPVVVCFDSVNGVDPPEAGIDGFYFGYDNTGASPVAIPAGPGNSLSGASVDDAALAPTVFAPGHVSPAFLALVGLDGTLPSWAVEGPDGVSRTAAATTAAPSCTPDLLAPTTPDARDPRLAFTLRGLPSGAALPSQVEVTATLTGLPATSTCSSGLDAMTPLVWIGDGSSHTVFGTALTSSLTVGSLQAPGGSAYRGVVGRFTVNVVDRCASAGAVSLGWPTNVSLDGLRDRTNVCAEVDGATVTEVPCPTLPYTGGIRTNRVLALS
ncbi:MAG: hypothetical protein ABIR68_00855 [Ilumatobacteraceae bacterium]